MTHKFTQEELDTAKALARELREHTGSHRWLYLCAYVLNLADRVEELEGALREIRDYKLLNEEVGWDKGEEESSKMRNIADAALGEDGKS